MSLLFRVDAGLGLDGRVEKATGIADTWNRRRITMEKVEKRGFVTAAYQKGGQEKNFIPRYCNRSHSGHATITEEVSSRWRALPKASQQSIGSIFLQGGGEKLGF